MKKIAGRKNDLKNREDQAMNESSVAVGKITPFHMVKCPI